MKIEIPFGTHPDNVVQLNIVRDGVRFRRMTRKCAHLKTTVDTTLATLECLGCGEKLNPVEWIANIAELFQGMRMERVKLDQARALYEAKTRTRCQHCDKLTKVRPATGAQVRKLERATTQDNGRPL